MSSEQIDKVINSYLELGPDGRRHDPRIGNDRHALIMSGSAILRHCYAAGQQTDYRSRIVDYEKDFYTLKCAQTV